MRCVWEFETCALTVSNTLTPLNPYYNFFFIFYLILVFFIFVIPNFFFLIFVFLILFFLVFVGYRFLPSQFSRKSLRSFWMNEYSGRSEILRFRNLNRPEILSWFWWLRNFFPKGGVLTFCKKNFCSKFSFVK